MEEDRDMYTRKEIKYNIDTAIQRTMYETESELYELLLRARSRLYEEFGINE